MPSNPRRFAVPDLQKLLCATPVYRKSCYSWSMLLSWVLISGGATVVAIIAARRQSFLNYLLNCYDHILPKLNADKPCPVLSCYGLWVWHGSSEWIGHMSVRISCKKVAEISPLMLVVADIFCLLWKLNNSKIHFMLRLMTSAKSVIEIKTAKVIVRCYLKSALLQG